MSQETGLFSVRRPRETLGGITHNVSAIPLPASAMKRSNSISNLQQAPYTTNHARSVSGPRMSLAPGRPNQPIFQRSNSGTNLPDMGLSTVQRPSMNNLISASTGARKSYAPINSAPINIAQLQQSSQRRSSVYSARQSSSGPGGHQSFFTAAPAPAVPPRDPRPLRDRSYQAQIAQELIDYMTHNNFELEMKHALSQNTMKSPTQKDFNYTFQWLYHRIDPSYHFQKSIDNEVVPILKQLRYPFDKSINKSQIVAVGGQNWPVFLGMLHWMMQLARMMDQFSVGNYDDACIDAGFDVSGDRIIFDFLTDAYHEWLAMEDDQEDEVEQVLKPHVATMAAKFDEANSKYLEQVKMLEAEHASLQGRIDEFGKSQPKLAKLDDQIKILEEDRGKFETYNASMEGKVEKYEGRVKMLEEEILKVEAELEEVHAERSSLQAAVDEQGITIEDIDRMNNERERLQKGVEGAAQRLEGCKKNVSNKETDATQRLETLERSIREYNSLGYQVGIIPATAVNAKGTNYELVLTIDAASETLPPKSPRAQTPQPDRLVADASSGHQPQHLLNLDVKGVVRSGIHELRKDLAERKNSAAEVDMNNKDLLDKIREAMEDKEQEVEGLGHRVRAAEEEFEKTREITNAQKMASDAQIEKLEKELAKMRTTLTESVQLIEQREMNTNIEYEQLTLRAAAVREELHTEVERMLNDVIKFKVHIQKSLEDYEQFVAEEVEKECEEQEVFDAAEEGEHDA